MFQVQLETWKSLKLMMVKLALPGRNQKVMVEAKSLATSLKDVISNVRPGLWSLIVRKTVNTQLLDFKKEGLSTSFVLVHGTEWVPVSQWKQRDQWKLRANLVSRSYEKLTVL